MKRNVRGDAITQSESTLLNCVYSSFSCPDADRLLNSGNKYLPVPKFSRSSRAHDCRHSRFGHFVGHYEIDLHFGQESYGVFAAPVNLGVPFLTTKAFHFVESHPVDPEIGKSLFHFVEFERFDNRFNAFHTGLW